MPDATNITILTIGDNDVIDLQVEKLNTIISGTMDPVENETVTVDVTGNTYTFTVGTDTLPEGAAPGAHWAVSVPTEILTYATSLTATGASVSDSRSYTVNSSYSTPPRGEITDVTVTFDEGQATIGFVYDQLDSSGFDYRIAIVGEEDAGWQNGEVSPINTGFIAPGSEVSVYIRPTNELGDGESHVEEFTMPGGAEAPLGITVDSITEDNVLSLAEAAGTISVEGTVSGPVASGDTVEVFVGSESYSTAVDEDGVSWAVDVPGSVMASDTEVTATITVTDPQTEVQESESETLSYTVESESSGPVGTIFVQDIAGDDIINIADAEGNINVTGTVSGDAEAGDPILIEIGGATYSTVVSANGTHWALGIDSANLTPYTSVTATVTMTDENDVEGTASNTRNYSVDLVAPSFALTVDPIAGDNVINAQDAAGTVAITGNVSGDNFDVGYLTIFIGEDFYETSISGNETFSMDVPGSNLVEESEVEVRVYAVGTNENDTIETVIRPYTLALSSPVPTIAINVISEDDTINLDESTANVLVSGTAGGDAADDDAVEVDIGMELYTTTVSGGTWAVTVPGSVMLTDTEVHATITSTDANDNIGTADALRAYTQDLEAPSPSLSIDVINGDDTLGYGAPDLVAVGGPITGDVAVGDVVTVTLGGSTYTTAVIDDEGTRWDVDIPIDDFVGSTTIGASVTVSDEAGNSSTSASQRSYTIDLAPSVPDAPTFVSVTPRLDEDHGTLAIVELVMAHHEAIQGDTLEFEVRIDGGDWVVTADTTIELVDVSVNDLHTLNIRSKNESGTSIFSTDSFTAVGPPLFTSSTPGVDGVSVTFTHNNLGTATYNYVLSSGGTAVATGTTMASPLVLDSLQPNTPYSLYLEEDGALLGGGQTIAFTTDEPVAIEMTVVVDAVSGDDVIDAEEVTGPIAVTGRVVTEDPITATVEVTVGATVETGTVSPEGEWSVNIPGSSFEGGNTVSVTVIPSVGDTVAEDRIYLVDGECGTVLPEGWTQSRKELRCSIIDYTTAMTPGQTITRTEGARHQEDFIQAVIDHVLEQDLDVCVGNMRYLISCVKAARGGIFNERYIFRFLQPRSFSLEERRRFVTLMTLIRIAADVSPSYAGQKVNVYELTGRQYTATMQRNLQVFFS